MKSKLENINDKIQNLEWQKKALENSIKKSKRNERTRKLIQVGALAQKYFELENNDLSEIEEIFKQFSSFVKENKLERQKK